MKTIDIIYTTINLIFIIATIIIVRASNKFRKRHKAILDGLTKRAEERDKNFDAFINECTEKMDIAHERIDLLSRENVKLIEQNLEMKERLRDLGIRDYDI